MTMLSKIKSLLGLTGIQEGDAVKITVDSKNSRASDYLNKQARVVDIITNSDASDGKLYGVSPLDSSDKIYLDRENITLLNE